MAPIKVAVFPLVKNKPELMAKARGIYESIQLRHSAFWDVSGAIGESKKSCAVYQCFSRIVCLEDSMKCNSMVIVVLSLFLPSRHEGKSDEVCAFSSTSLTLGIDR